MGAVIRILFRAIFVAAALLAAAAVAVEFKKRHGLHFTWALFVEDAKVVLGMAMHDPRMLWIGVGFLMILAKSSALAWSLKRDAGRAFMILAFSCLGSVAYAWLGSGRPPPSLAMFVSADWRAPFMGLFIGSPVFDHWILPRLSGLALRWSMLAQLCVFLASALAWTRLARFLSGPSIDQIMGAHPRRWGTGMLLACAVCGALSLALGMAAAIAFPEQRPAVPAWVMGFFQLIF